MATIGDRLKKLRLDKGLTGEELSEIFNKKYDAKFSRSLISRLENDSRNLSKKNAKLYSRFFGVSEIYLYYGDQKKNAFRRLDNSDFCTIPLYRSIGAGFGSMENDFLGYISVPKVSSRNCFAVFVDGDSMSPEIPDSSIAIIDSSAKVNFGDVGAFKHNESDFLKMLIKKGSNTLLHSFNPKYKDILISSEDDFIIYGKLIKLLIDY